MKVVLTNLSNQLYQSSRFRLNESARKFGINEFYSYDYEEILTTIFFNDNREILEQPKGIGYWLWKPYIILDTLKKVEDGDIVIYSDAGIEIIDNLDPLISICKEKEDILLFGNSNFLNKEWTKRDCFILMGCDNEQYWNGIQCDAAFALFKKTEFSLKFLKEWLGFGCNKFIISDLPNTCGKVNLPGYVGHRQDQSILSLLAQRYKITLYRMPSQFGNHYKMYDFRIENEFNCINQNDRQNLKYYFIIPYYNSCYGQLIDHHRSINTDQTNVNSSNMNKNSKGKIINLIGFLKMFVLQTFKKMGYEITKID